MNIQTTFPNEHDYVRQMFAEEENMPADQAAISYSDSKLQALRTADPNLYDKWLKGARKWHELQISS